MNLFIDIFRSLIQSRGNNEEVCERSSSGWTVNNLNSIPKLVYLCVFLAILRSHGPFPGDDGLLPLDAVDFS